MCIFRAIYTSCDVLLTHNLNTLSKQPILLFTVQFFCTFVTIEIANVQNSILIVSSLVLVTPRITKKIREVTSTRLDCKLNLIVLKTEQQCRIYHCA